MTDVMNHKLTRFIQILIFYTLLVILWGAWVRISHSGDGCGDSWPLCQGQIVPDQGSAGKTWVELSHRLTSGLFGILIVALYIWIRKAFTKDHLIRRWSLFSLIFTITEALLGAALVKFELVTGNDSPWRAFAMSLHFLNSLLLMGSLTLTWDFSKRAGWQKRTPQDQPWQTPVIGTNKMIFSFVGAFLLLGLTGAIAALSNSLFPSSSLIDGFFADWQQDSHYLIRLRGLHPLMGVLIGSTLCLTAWFSVSITKASETLLASRAKNLALVTAAGVVFGILTLVTLAPVPLKISHLALAHGIWVFLILWIRELCFKPARQN